MVVGEVNAAEAKRLLLLLLALRRGRAGIAFRRRLVALLSPGFVDLQTAATDQRAAFEHGEAVNAPWQTGPSSSAGSCRSGP